MKATSILPVLVPLPWLFIPFPTYRKFCTNIQIHCLLKCIFQNVLKKKLIKERLLCLQTIKKAILYESCINQNIVRLSPYLIF